jgi:hypothetical protein
MPYKYKQSTENNINFEIDNDKHITKLIFPNGKELFSFDTKKGFDLDTIRALKNACIDYLESYV